MGFVVSPSVYILWDVVVTGVPGVVTSSMGLAISMWLLPSDVEDNCIVSKFALYIFFVAFLNGLMNWIWSQAVAMRYHVYFVLQVLFIFVLFLFHIIIIIFICRLLRISFQNRFVFVILFINNTI